MSAKGLVKDWIYIIKIGLLGKHQLQKEPHEKSADTKS